MRYEVRLTNHVKEDLVRLAKSEPKAFAKAGRFLKELEEHPKTGTGHPGSSESREERALASFSEMKERRRSQPLKGQPANRWSREITKKHRMVYCIYDTEVQVEVLAAYGHYNDK